MAVDVSVGRWHRAFLSPVTQSPGHLFRAAEPGFPLKLPQPLRVSTCGAWASSGRLHPPAASYAALSASFHFNPCRRWNDEC